MSEELTIAKDDINEIPDIHNYKEIIKAAKSGNLIIFVGAGVSKLIGLPLWNEFALERLNTIYKKELIDFRTYEKLKSLDAKKLLTICDMFMKENNIEPSLAKDIFKFENNERYKDVYAKLYSINAIYITTNYDECLDQLALQFGNSEEPGENIDEKNRLKKEVIVDRSELLESKLKNGNVIHIHGSVNKEKEMLVTLNDYLDCYGTISKKSYPEISIFLDKVFNSKYVVLFMGYGLEEYEILEYMLSKSKNPKHTKKHYMLYSTYKEDYKMINFLSKYYNNFGIDLIPYDISRKGYEQLISIIDGWAKVLSEVSRDQDFIHKTLLIEDAFKSEDLDFKVRARTVIDLIKNDESLAVYFFEHVDDIRWLSILKKENFYIPERVPKPIKVENGYRIPYWAQTEYLKKIVEQLQSENEEEIKEILSIVKTITLYKDNEGKHIDNYHVWNHFIEILSKIPNQYIDLEIIQMIEVWTDSMFKIDFISYEISRKLLFKFLKSQEKEDIIKAEKIIECLLKLDCENNQIKIPNYYFYKVFTKDTVRLISEKCSEGLLVHIRKQMYKFLDNPESNIVFDYDDNQYILKVSNLTEKYAIEILKTTKKNESLYTLQLPKVKMEDFVEQVANWIFTKLDEEKIESNLESKIRSLYYSLYNKETYNSLYKVSRAYNEDGFELLLNLFKNLLVQRNEYRMENFLINLIYEDHFFFQKVLLYVIGNKYSTYKNIFWDMLNQKKGEFIFQDSAFEDELRIILEQLEDLTKDQEEKLLDLINKGPNNYYKLENEQKYIDIWKQKRLSALKQMPVFNAFYTELKEKTKLSLTLGPRIGEVKTKWGSSPSPLTEDELLKMTNNEIAEYMKTFKTTDFWEGPTSDALGETMKAFTKKYPSRIVDNLDPFINTNYYYIYQILSGLSDGWREKESFNWGELLDFILNYISRPEFWKDKFKMHEGMWDANYKWVLNVVCELVRIGSDNIDWTFEDKHFNKAKEVLLYILREVKNLEQGDSNNDSISYVLNSVKGTALQAVLTMSIMGKRISKEEKWDNDFKTIYTEYLKHDIVDAFILLGWKLQYFVYLEKDWTIDKINSITFEHRCWESFMAGYINCRSISEDIYILMKEHYHHAIDYNFKEKDVRKNLAEHLAIGYLYAYEKEINKELYEHVLRTWNYEILEEFIRSFCLQEKKNPNEQNRHRIIDFWETLYQKYSEYTIGEFSESDKKLLSESLNLIFILNDIEETNYQKIKLAIPFAEVNYNSHVIIEGLYQKINEGDLKNKRVIMGELLNDLVENCTPTYPEETIVSLVKYLYDGNYEQTTDIAENICNLYTKNNINFLREVYLMYKNDL
ncbi:hypothetical protein HAU06_00535 [Bacillus toyonensis]|uniref:SIR2 family protein n=1 Tax=Bacillus toyonensis TaxID=155322 RepID=UPI001639BD4B|nr:SIR2 family protein [Bacillus toyonensis]MBC2682698.1 hypothetical protein [Bacillus toyonensis]